jgi:hypothetical protein
MEWTNLKVEMAIKFQKPEHQIVSFHNASGEKFIIPADIRPIPLLTPKCSAQTDQAKLSRANFMFPGPCIFIYSNK